MSDEGKEQWMVYSGWWMVEKRLIVHGSWLIVEKQASGKREKVNHL